MPKETEESKSEDWRHSRQPALFRGGSIEVDHQALGLKLVDAATEGDFDLCEQLLLEGADPNFATVPYRYTPLIKACRMHRVDVVNLLLSYNADPNCSSRNGWTPLIEASRTGHAELVELLISKGAKINAQNVMGWTALMEACRNRHLPVIKILCQNGANLSIVDRDHMVALDHVSSALLDIRTYIERFWASNQPATYISPQARAQIDEHRSPEDLLVESARNDDFATVRTLIVDKGVDVNSLSVHGSYSALIFAARSQNREMVEFLISKGANVSQVAEGGWTPIIEASRVGNKAILDLLIQTLKDQGATPAQLLAAVNSTNIFGWHALIEACRNNNYDVVERLVQLGADVLKKDEDGDSAMDHAVNNWIRGLLQGSVEGPRAAVRNKLQQTRQMSSEARVKEVVAKIQEVIERSGDSTMDSKQMMHRPSSVDTLRHIPTRMPTEDLRQTIFEACVQELDTAVVRAVLRLEGFRMAVLSSRTNIIHALVDLDLYHIVPPILASASEVPPAEWPRISDVMEAILDELFGYGVDSVELRRRFISSPDHLNGRTATVECAIKYADIIEREWQRVAKDEKDQLRQQMTERLSGPDRKVPTTPKPSSGKLSDDRTRGHSRGGSALPGISAAASTGRGGLPQVDEVLVPRPSHSSFAAVGIPDEARYYAETLRFLVQNGAKLSEHDAGNTSVAHHLLRPIALVNPFPKALDDVIQNFAILHRTFRSSINGPKVWNMKTSPDDITPLCLLLRANPHVERENLVFALLEDGAMMPFSDSDSHKFELEQAILMSMVAARLRGNPMMAWNLIKAAVRNGDLRLIERTLQRNLPVYMVRPDYVPVLDRTHLSAKTSPAQDGESAYAFSHVPAYNDKSSQAMLLEDVDKCLLHYAAFQEDPRSIKERQQIFKLLLDYSEMPCKASPVDPTSFWPWPNDPDSKGQGLAWMNHNMQNIFHIVAGKRDNITVLNAIYFKELLRRDANANCSQLDGMGWSPLHYASFLNKKDIVHELGTSHLDLMHRTHVEGRTALHLAALRGNWIVVQSLLARGVAVDLIDSKGCTALTLAMLERQRLLASETAARVLQERTTSLLVDAAAKAEKNPSSPGAGPERRPSSLQPAFSVEALPHLADRGSIVVELGRMPTSPSAAIEHQRLMDETHEFAVGGLSSAEPLEPSDESSHCAHCLDCHCVRPSLGDCVALCLPCLPLSAQKKREAALAAAQKKEKKEENKRIAAPGDHAKGSVLYAETIKALLNYGASIQKASSASGYPLSRLMDVTERWTEIYNTLNEIEAQKRRVAKKYFKKIRAKKQTPDGKKPVLDLPQRREAKREMRLRQNVLHTLREHVFLDKENQVVIGQYYDDKIRRGRFTKFARYFFYLVLLSVLAIWETTTTPEGAYYMQRGLKNSLGTPAFSGMNSKEDFYNWARTDLTSTLYSSAAFYDMNNQMPLGNILQYNLVMDRPRLRQIRSKVTTCDVPHEFKEFPVLAQDLCVASHLDEEDEEPHLVNGHLYTWEPDTGANLRWSRVTRYPGSGYVTLLPNLGATNSSQTAVAIFNQLQADNWIDAGTRAVFFEMTLFNANKNIFFVVSMAIEFPREGGVVPSYDFSVLRLRRYTDSADQKMFALEMIVLFLGIIHIWSESVQFRNSRGCEYFSSLYNWLDASIVILSVTIVGLHVATFVLEKDINWYDPDVYLRIHRQEALAFAEQICFSLVVFFAWAKLFDYLSVFKEIYRFVIMIEMMAKRLGEFSIVFLLVIGMFTTAELVAYGYKDDASYSWPLAYVNRFIGVVAQNPVVFDHSNQARLLGTFYVVLFLIISVLLLMNLIIAMLTRAYEEALQLSSDVLAARQYEKLKDLGYTKPLPIAKRVFGIDEAANTPAEASYSEILDIRWYLVCASMARAVDDWMDRHCRSDASVDLDEEVLLEGSSHSLNTGGANAGAAYSADPLTGNLFAGR